MITAEFRVLLLGCSQQFLHEDDNCASSRQQEALQVYFSMVAQLKDVQRYPACSDNCWHQHAIHAVIRHLFIVWVQPKPVAIASLCVQHQELFTSIEMLLNRKLRNQMLMRSFRQTGQISFIKRCTGIHLALLQGIRDSHANGHYTLKDRNFPQKTVIADGLVVMRCD